MDDQQFLDIMIANLNAFFKTNIESPRIKKPLYSQTAKDLFPKHTAAAEKMGVSFGADVPLDKPFEEMTGEELEDACNAEGICYTENDTDQDLINLLMET